MNVTPLRKVYSGPSDGLVVGQRRSRVTVIKPAMGCDADPTLNRNSVGRPTSSVQVHRRKILIECWLAPAMVVKGINVKDIFKLVSLVLSLMYPGHLSSGQQVTLHNVLQKNSGVRDTPAQVWKVERAARRHHSVCAKLISIHWPQP